jgi:C4-dicarboxylate transporter DctQ subunit
VLEILAKGGIHLIKKINKFFLFFEDIVFPNLGTVFFVISVFWMMIEAISRQLLNRSFAISVEVITFCILWAVFLTLAQAGKQDYHISIDIVISRLPERARKAFDLLSIFLGFLFSLILLYASIKSITHLYETGLTSHSPLRLPMWGVTLAIPIGSILLALYYLRSFIQKIKGGEEAKP